MDLVIKNSAALKQYVSELQPSIYGKFLYYCLPYRKKVVLSNMQQVLGKVLTKQELIKLAQSFYSHIATSLRENLQMRFMSLDKIKQHAKVLNPEYAIKAAEQNKGVLLLTGHFGNWEFAPIAGILNFQQFRDRLYFVRKSIGAKFLEKTLFNRFYKAGLNIITKKNALPKVLDALEHNNGVVFVMDQNATVAAKDGIEVEFFGKPAGTYRSLATIVRYTGVDVIPVKTYRQKNGKHVMQFYPPIAWQECDSARDELHVNTRNYNQVLEQMILQHPEQWLWMHKRWKK